MDSGSNSAAIEEAIQQLLNPSTDASNITSATTTLAAASRSTPSVRQKLADPNVLERLIKHIEDPLEPSSSPTAALRCIGNACIDNDDARETVTNLGFTWARKRLQSSDTEIRNLTILVLVNVCMDYEPCTETVLPGEPPPRTYPRGRGGSLVHG